MKVLHQLGAAIRGAATGGTRPHAAAIDHRHSTIGVEQLLFRLIDADMNVTTDQAFTKEWAFAKYTVTRILVNGASIDLTAADGGIYAAAAKAGDPLVAAEQVYTALTAAAKGLDLTLTADALGILTATPILSLTGAQGAAATADFYIFGIPISATDEDDLTTTAVED